MSVIVDRCLRRSQVVRELVENWQIEHEQAMFARDLEELIRECQDLEDLLNKGWRALLECLFEEGIEDVDGTGRAMQAAVDVSLKVCEQVCLLVSAARRKNYEIEGSECLDTAVQRMRTLKEEISKKWPSVDQEMVRQSMTAFQRGDYQSAEDMLHGLENSCAKAD